MRDMHPKSIYLGFKYAFAGIIHCYFTQCSMRIHAIAAVLAVGLALYVQLSAEEWIMLVITIAGVAVAEMGNTAIETVVDLVSPEFHPLAKIAKDVAAGAVLVAVFAALFVGYLIFFHRLFG